MTKKKILYIGNKLSEKGITVTSIETLGTFLREEGYTVYMASSVKNKVFRMLDMFATTFKYRNKVSVVLIDTYSTQNFQFAVAVASLCRLLHLPYIPILRGGNLPDRIKRSPSASKKLFNGAKTNVAPSSYLYSEFKNAGYSNLTYIPNTIALKKYPFLLRKRPKYKLLWVRSFAEIYNPMLALYVVQHLKDRGKEVALCMIGPEKDGMLQQCRTFAAANNLPVAFTGKLSKEAWIATSEKFDIFINTTNFDNTPVSVIEAMALGLPVVSTHVGGVPYLIAHGTEGMLVPPDDVAAMVSAIEHLITAPHAAVTMAENARQKVEAFDWETVKHTWETLLNE